jgi:hypothetical protein
VKENFDAEVIGNVAMLSKGSNRPTHGSFDVLPVGNFFCVDGLYNYVVRPRYNVNFLQKRVNGFDSDTTSQNFVGHLNRR